MLLKRIVYRFKNANEPKDVVKNWMRSRSTIEFIGLWEELNNLNFKGVEFDSFYIRQEVMHLPCLLQNG